MFDALDKGLASVIRGTTGAVGGAIGGGIEGLVGGSSTRRSTSDNLDVLIALKGLITPDTPAVDTAVCLECSREAQREVQRETQKEALEKGKEGEGSIYTFVLGTITPRTLGHDARRDAENELRRRVTYNVHALDTEAMNKFVFALDLFDPCYMACKDQWMVKIPKEYYNNTKDGRNVGDGTDVLEVKVGYAHLSHASAQTTAPQPSKKYITARFLLHGVRYWEQ